jgi:hypothetical protein
MPERQVLVRGMRRPDRKALHSWGVMRITAGVGDTGRDWRQATPERDCTHMPSVDFSVPLPQLLFLLGLGLAFLGLIGAKGTIREIAFDLSPTANRFAAVGFGVALVLVGTQYPRLFPPVAEAASPPAATPTVAVAPTSLPAPVVAVAASPTSLPAPVASVAAAPVASAENWECSLPGNFHVRDHPGRTYHLNGDPLQTGDRVRVSGWSKPSDNSSDLSWFRIAVADGRIGWIISAATIGDTRLYLTCNFASEGPQYPFPQLSVN